MTITVTFFGTQEAFTTDVPVQLSEAAAQCNLWIEHACGARGKCTKCRVRFHAGAPPATPADCQQLPGEQRERGWRLACQAVVEADALVEVSPAPRTVGLQSFGPDTIEVVSRSADTPPCGARRAPVTGFAIDVGSSTLAVALVDLVTTRVLATASGLNPQARFGADVVSRIAHAQRQGGGELTRTVREALAALSSETLRAAQARAEDVASAVLCGNAVMTHLLVGADVTSLGRAPYLGSFTAARELAAGDLGLPAGRHARARVFPQVGGHVGGDTVAAVLAAGMDRAVQPELLIDLGTNTEIVLASPARCLAASAAAGPAFEGASITHGMRAAPGAIDRVSLVAGRLLTRVQGKCEARGLCGTGLIDAVAALLDAGVIAASGRMCSREDAPPRTYLASRLVEDRNGGRALLLAEHGASGGGILLTASDVRQLQLVKGSIGAAAETLLARIGAVSAELAAIHLCGAFGSVVRKESAIRIGLVPAIDPERMHCLGSAAGLGARMALCDRAAWQRAGALGHRIEHVDLARDPHYGERFAAAMRFPCGPEDP